MKNKILEAGIKEKLSDGNKHTFNELFDDIVLKFPELKLDKKRISNILYRMRKQIPGLEMIDKGVYIMKNGECEVVEKEKYSRKYLGKLKSDCLKMQQELSEKPFEKYSSGEEWMDARCLYDFLSEIVVLIEEKGMG